VRIVCVLVLAALWVAAPAVAAEPDFTPQMQALAGVVACAPGVPLPPRFDAKLLAAHCRQLAMLQRWWQRRWLARAKPFLEKVVPSGLPTKVVYPFGGGDLLTALVTFPEATEITTLSLEPAGDPTSIDTIAPEDIDEALTDVRGMASNLFAVAHSKTSNMRKMVKAKFAGELTSALVALVMSDFVPVSLRYFRVGPTGELQYITSAEVEAASGAAERMQLFANVEITFRARGPGGQGSVEAGGGAPRVFRHLTANLDDTHLTADPAVLRYLEGKGPITAITKAASYLLWWKGFSQIRAYLLEHMVWMISDSTGIPPEDATAAGFEQIPYGHFEGPFLKAGLKPTEAFQKLWTASLEPLPFRFGYPDSAGNSHLLITRHPVK
jgi:hypothetical protein